MAKLYDQQDKNHILVWDHPNSNKINSTKRQTHKNIRKYWTAPQTTLKLYKIVF
jgi:hypothetical protein